jgi:ABC-type polysaccharide/polyol phosphate export permease
MFPERARWLLYLNPMTHLVDAYRQIFYYHANPNIGSLLYILGLSSFLLITGFAIFKKLEKGFAENL